MSTSSVGDLRVEIPPRVSPQFTLVNEKKQAICSIHFASFGIRNLVDSLGKEGRRKVSHEYSHVACHENLASVLVERDLAGCDVLAGEVQRALPAPTSVDGFERTCFFFCTAWGRFLYTSFFEISEFEFAHVSNLSLKNSQLTLFF